MENQENKNDILKKEPQSQPQSQSQTQPETQPQQQQQYQPYSPQQPYQPPQPQPQPQYYTPQSYPPMTLKDWIVTMLLMLIPIANLILPFMWAFGSDVNPSKKTYFQAMLIMALVGIVFWIVIVIFFGAVLYSIGTSTNFSY
jgi:hypothetical protein